MDDAKTALALESKRLEENCLYTSTSLFIWLRSRRRLKNLFIVGPLVLGSAASWKLLTETDLPSVRLLVSVFAFVAGVLPSVYAALKFDDQLEIAARSAAEFKNLQDRFRQLANVSVTLPWADFHNQFLDSMARLEAVRMTSLTPPERFFRAAQKKIQAGHYRHDVDEAPGKPKAS